MLDKEMKEMGDHDIPGMKEMYDSRAKLTPERNEDRPGESWGQ